MRIRVAWLAACALLWYLPASAQQPETMTFVSDYTVKAGHEADFTDLVKTVGGPVRDKLMAEGVVMAWGVDVPVTRSPGGPTHSIWYAAANLEGVQKVQDAMAARLASLDKATQQKVQDTFDASKTKDWLFRDLVAVFSSAPPPAGLLPYSRINLLTIKPGKFAEYRQAWEKYNKPILDKLMAEGTIGAYGIGTEEARSSGDFTHFTWTSVPSLAAGEKVRRAFISDRDGRPAAEREMIAETFRNLTDPAATRAFLLRAVVFKVAPPRK